MKRRVSLIILALAVIAQIWVPASLIVKSQRTLISGKQFKFRTAPVDPYDAFRGKYVALGFDADRFACSDRSAYRHGRQVFVLLNRDSDGFAQIAGLSRNKPAQGDFVKVKISSFSDSSVIVNYPFDKFYLEEGLAGEAEKLYRQHSRRGQLDTYALVRINKGFAVIEDLVIGGTPVVQSIKNKG